MTLPGGTVSLLFTDIEGSTALLRDLGDRYAAVVAQHRRLLREVVDAAGGQEVDTQGDAFFFAFSRVRDALSAAVEGQRALHGYDWPGGVEVRVRMGLHTGEPAVTDEGYVGMDVVRAARICAAGHGGQVLVSAATRALLGADLPSGVRAVDLGERHLKDVGYEHLYQLVIDGLPEEFPPVRHHAEGREEALARLFTDRITDQVERQLRAAFEPLTSDPPPPAPPPPAQ
jgi:class 3 adenylate cyclase